MILNPWVDLELLWKSMSLNSADVIQPLKISSGYLGIWCTLERYRQNGDVICCK